MMDIYTKKEETLEILKIYPMKTLALETKLENKSFMDYDPNQMMLKINVW